MVKKIKDPNAPKRPLSGFILFGNDLRANDEKIRNLPIKEQSFTIGKLWSELGEAEKAKYNERSLGLKQEYAAQREAYEKTDEYKKFVEESKNAGNKKDKTKKRAGPTKVSAYRIFVSETKESPDDEKDSELAGKGHMAKCGIKWARLSDAEKKVYQDKADKMNFEPKKESKEQDSD